MSEFLRKVSPASAFLPVVGCLSPASVFWHQGSIRYRWSRISPALHSSGNNRIEVWSECELSLWSPLGVRIYNNNNNIIIIIINTHSWPDARMAG